MPNEQSKPNAAPLFRASATKRAEISATASPFSPRIVGILHTEACLKKLTEEKHDWSTSDIDLLEVRLDTLQSVFKIFEKCRYSFTDWNIKKNRPFSTTLKGSFENQYLTKKLAKVVNDYKWPLPVIATARDQKEGGLNELSLMQRQKLLESSLPWASMIDVELHSAKELTNTIARAREARRSIILSYHNFQKTPSLIELRNLTKHAYDTGATIFKIATIVHSEEELRRLLEFQQLPHPLPVATMGMGPLGKKSRLQVAAAGSALVYGWLYEPLSMIPSSTQWSARELARIFHGKS